MEEHLENKEQAEEINLSNEENISAGEHAESEKHTGGLILIIPLLLSIYLFLGFTNVDSKKHSVKKNTETTESGEEKAPRVNFSALLAPEEFSKNLRDTVYTDKNLWLELRIDEQKLHVHYRNGTEKTYLVSTGNKFVSKGVESRPGLFAIFLKEEIHKSSQFNNAQMNYYMPYNMGIGFHGLPGTGYYGFLGVRPSSHGCIRMRNEDVRALFKECDIGVLVLAHSGKSTRTVAFVPEGFKNDAEYTKEDYINMLAYNMSSLIEGKYFINPPKRFVLDGKIIPRSGINVFSTDAIPEKQLLPFAVFNVKLTPDRLALDTEAGDVKELNAASYAGLFEFSGSDSLPKGNVELAVNPDLVKKYAHNPVGILPYFPPNR